jgi:hypothetical protein
MAQISPLLAASDLNAAIKFYQAAFGADPVAPGCRRPCRRRSFP